MLIGSVENYVALRRTVGFKLDSVERLLRLYVDFAVERGDSHVVSKTAIEWASHAGSEPQRDTRLKAVILFARFVRAEDEQHEVPPEGVFCGRRQRPTPYIFSEEEIQQLLAVAARLGRPGTLQRHTYSTLFALLAVTGLRISEALKLRIGDLTDDGLVIREGKFRKNRLVPLHKTAVSALESYLEKRAKFAGNDDHLFVSQRKRQLAYTTVVGTFHKVLKTADIPRKPSRSRPNAARLSPSAAATTSTAKPRGNRNSKWPSKSGCSSKYNGQGSRSAPP